MEATPGGFNRAIGGGRERKSLTLNNKSLARNNKTWMRVFR
jgi:hypothetical protein